MTVIPKATPRNAPMVLLAPVEVGTGMPVLPVGCCSLLLIGPDPVALPAEVSTWVTAIELPTELVVAWIVGTGSPVLLVTGLEAPGVAETLPLG